MQRQQKLALAAATVALACAAPLASAQARFDRIDPPGSRNTEPFGVNDSGVVVGLYDAAASRSVMAFVYANGTYTTVLPAGASSASLAAVNNAGLAVGSYSPCGTTCYANGFTYSAGVATPLPLPYADMMMSHATAINQAGAIAGTVVDAGNVTHGWTFSNGVYALFDIRRVKGGYAEVTDISDSGIVVGCHTAGYGCFHNTGDHSFYSKGGHAITFDPPGSILSVANGVNGSGTIVGTYDDAQYHQHGYVYQNGTFTTIDAPGAVNTSLSRIRDNGEIVGDVSGSLAVGSFTLKNGVFKVILNSTSTITTGLSKSGLVTGIFDITRGFRVP